MESPDVSYRFRLALSYTETATEKLTSADADRADKTIDSEKYAQLRSFYLSHIEKAQDILQELREEEKRNSDAIQRQLNDLIDRQQRLVVAARSGGEEAARANEENRRYLSEIEALKERQDSSASALAAQSSLDLGGRIELELEDFVDRIKADETKKRSSILPRFGFFVGALIALGLLAFALGTLGTSPDFKSVAFEARVVDAAGHLIEITCSNRGVRDITFHVPWPNGIATAPGAEDDNAFGIEVRVLESRAGEFHVLPDSQGCWQYKGLPLLGSGPVIVRPGISATVTMDVDRLAAMGLKLEAVQLRFSRADGRSFGKFEMSYE